MVIHVDKLGLTNGRELRIYQLMMGRGWLEQWHFFRNERQDETQSEIRPYQQRAGHASRRGAVC